MKKVAMLGLAMLFTTIPVEETTAQKGKQSAEKLVRLSSSTFTLGGGRSLCITASQNAYWYQRAYVTLAQGNPIGQTFQVYSRKTRGTGKRTMALPPGGPWVNEAQVTVSADYFNENVENNKAWVLSNVLIEANQLRQHYIYRFNDTEPRLRYDRDKDFDDTIVDIQIVRGSCPGTYYKDKELLKPVKRPQSLGDAPKPEFIERGKH